MHFDFLQEVMWLFWSNHIVFILDWHNSAMQKFVYGIRSLGIGYDFNYVLLHIKVRSVKRQDPIYDN